MLQIVDHLLLIRPLGKRGTNELHKLVDGDPVLRVQQYRAEKHNAQEGNDEAIEHYPQYRPVLDFLGGIRTQWPFLSQAGSFFYVPSLQRLSSCFWRMRNVAPGTL
jgi:hypothetical protein